MSNSSDVGLLLDADEMADAFSSSIGGFDDEWYAQQLAGSVANSSVVSRSARSAPQSVVDVAIAAAMDALPERLSVREMAASAGVSLWSLQRAFERAHHATPVAHVQHLCLERAPRS